jgi:hypothetical protein
MRTTSLAALCGFGGICLGGGYAYAKSFVPAPSEEKLVNWAGTHAAQTDRFYAPESLEEVLPCVHRHEKREDKIV